ncbi:MAG: type IV secretion system DNA-binding domain-containing protein [Fusobacteriaceae bacterium]
MSNTFYNYICSKVIDYFEKNGLEKGKKYNLSFDNEEKVVQLYRFLKSNYNTKEFIYESYKTIEISIGETSLLIAAAINGVTVDYLTKLRNLISEGQNSFENRSILFLHNSTLDSLVGGSESLSKAGLPLNVKEIKKDIKQMIKDLELHNRLIIIHALESFEDDISNSLALFEYEYILNIIHAKNIELVEYKFFDLYPDPELNTYKSEKEIKQRIKENGEIFKEITTAKKYGDLDNDLSDKYEINILDKIKRDEYINYAELKKSIEKKQEAEKLTYKEDKSKNLSEENLIYWEVPDGETKVKRRKRNFLIFNPENKSEINIFLSFEERVLTNYIKNGKNKCLDINPLGKRINVKIDSRDEKISDFKLMTSKITYEFKFMVVNTEENYFKDIIGKWNLKNKKLQITSNENELFLNKHIDSLGKELYINSTTENKFSCNADEKIKLCFESCEEDLEFELNINNQLINCKYIEDKQTTNEIRGIDLWLLKNNKQDNFYFATDNFREKNKIIFGSKEYYTKNSLHKMIVLEQQVIEQGSLFYKEDSDSILTPQELNNIPCELKKAYENIVNYFKENKLIPSFTYIDDSLKILYTDYIETFVEIFKNTNFEEKNIIKELMNIGKIISTVDSKTIYLTPLHPLNVLYQLEIQKEINEEELNQNIAKHLKSSNLLPYLYKEQNSLYKVFEQNFAMEWKIYSEESSKEYTSSKDYLPTLFSDKLKEFMKHFSYLFELNVKSPLQINLVNMGNCKEIANGIFKFIVYELNTKSPKDISPIVLNIHSEQDYLTIFEEINIYRTIKEIEENLDIIISTKDFSKDEILEIYMEKVSFYKKNNIEIDYGHLTFYEMDKNLIEESYESMNNLNTGISFNGFNSTLTPSYIGNAYKNGFGIKGASENKLIDLAKIYNTISRVSEKSDPYNSEHVIVTNISENKINKLDNIYEKSHWVIFIDPKVDINFFKGRNDELIIIHYSDQYTVNAGYDAITVTRKTKIYEDILIRELQNKLDSSKIENVPKMLINQFNTINGDWLLKFSRNNNKEFAKEKISILSSIRFGLKYLKSLDDGTIWIPISLEEILRVTGSAGLSQNDGIFSKKNLGISGECSDDLLFIGIKFINGKPALYLYPVEVKIGENDNKVISKAFKQCSKLVDKLNSIFEIDSFENKFYRNFLIQVIYSTIEKFIVYDFGDKKDWSYLQEDEVKKRLLNNNFSYGYFRRDTIGEFGIFSFKKSVFSRKLVLSQENKDDSSNELSNFLIANFTENDGYDFVSTDEYTLDRIIETVSDNNSYFPNLSTTIDSDNKLQITEPSIDEETKSDSITCVEQNSGMQINFGQDDYGREYLWNPNDTNMLMHPNTAIIGTMGTGKTQFTKSMITQLYRERKNNVGNRSFGILIFDYKGDYIKEDFVKETDAKVLDPYHLPFNPLSIFNTENSKPLLPLHTATTIKDTLAKGSNLGPVQESILRELLLESYELVGINKIDRSTWNNPAPTFKDVFNLYESKEEMKRDSLYSALSELVEYELFEPDRNKVKTLYDLLEGVVVIKLNGYNESTQNLIVAMTLDLFYSQMQINGHSIVDKNLREINKIILVDEADNFLSKDFSSVKKILKEGREFGVGTILSTQFLSHFITGENDYTNYMETWIIHKVAKITNKEVKAILGTNTKNEEDLYINEISDLKKHYSLVKSGNRAPQKIKDLAFWELIQN